MAKKKKSSAFAVVQQIGKSFFLPVSVLPIAGILLGLGSSFTNADTIAAYHLQGIMGEGTILNALLTIMSQVGNTIFGNLPLIFALAVALGMAKNEKLSRIRLLKNATLPTCAPAISVSMTPDRLYQPKPLAMAAPSRGTKPVTRQDSDPPKIEPSTMPRVM